MFEIARYEGRNRLKGSVYLSIGMALLAALVVWVYPSFSDALGGDELLEAYPEEMLQVFRIETMASLEGFLAFELYTFGWIVLLGLYVAYAAAGAIADDVDRGRMDTLLAMPISRARLVAEKFFALSVPILVVNLLTPPVLLVGSRLIDEPLAVGDIVAAHLLSIPYLFACAGIGLLCSVVFDRVGIAQRVALAVTFALFLAESLLAETDAEAFGAIAPMRYYDPNEILLEGTYDLVGAAVLVGMTVALLVVSQLVFRRSDI
ncbi:ABC transporter permease subunit [Natronococcus occultus]|uniref:ABC-type transport system involved in multi-copper enzyme maturation, permease component n=1 Tax=Natronococcus occultus SP4 TaxID=694430 RepID=L0K4C6_9EURY|nr:ABC transporter permease subunit [Natronococcus occultus]AGB39395.1 ABC-type transport system involved in multi-copper enzyme maturation, permease component [Natronococcus occultus SP4]